MRHTPGPWSWQIGQPHITRHWDGKSRVVATVNGDLAWHEDDNCASREAGSNASLIAAAPELLEALQNMVDAHRGVCVMPTKEARQQNAALEQASAAIAKATGKAA